MSSTASTRGFTLFETLIATGILVTALAGIAQMFVLSAQLTRQATASGAALVSAQDKLEWLRGRPLTYDADGAAITDPALQISPPETLEGDDEPYVDWVGEGGAAVESERDAAFVRRWRVASVGASEPDAISIEVCVFTAPAGNHGADACLSTIRSRQP
jgi:Tfp pilus assembly protein PilV